MKAVCLFECDLEPKNTIAYEIARQTICRNDYEFSSIQAKKKWTSGTILYSKYRKPLNRILTHILLEASGLYHIFVFSRTLEGLHSTCFRFFLSKAYFHVNLLFTYYDRRSKRHLITR